MKSTKTLKAACLSVGLATAWSPLGGQTAQAGTVVNVSLNIGTSGTANPGSYSNIGFGLLYSDNSYQTYNLGTHTTGSYLIPLLSSAEIDDIVGFVSVGLAPNTGTDDPHVMMTIASPNEFPDPFSWTDVFTTPPYNSESYAAADLGGLLQYILTSQTTNVIQLPGTEAGLFEFSNAVLSGNINVDLEAVSVPLPRAWMLGGALFALMMASKRTVKWIRLQPAQSLA